MNNFFSTFKYIATRPKFAFQQLDNNSAKGWQPLLLILLTINLFWFGYFNYIDLDWLHQQQLNLYASNVSPAEVEQLKVALPNGEAVKNSIMLTSTLFLLFHGLLLATILNVLTKLDEENVDGFTDWLSRSWWTMLPLVPQLLLALLVLYGMGSDKVMYQDLFITSLNKLLELEQGHMFYVFAEGFDVFSIWSYILLFYLVATKTKLATSTCLTISLVPLVVEIAISYLMS
ncbi:YIP1 family protein [Saccharobesus litoralis]|nr:YIP1 family protein [Saccharobesus litoralis]